MKRVRIRDRLVRGFRWEAQYTSRRNKKVGKNGNR